MGELNGKCGDGLEMVIENNISFSFSSSSSSFFFVKKNMWETLQNDHDTNNE